MIWYRSLKYDKITIQIKNKYMPLPGAPSPEQIKILLTRATREGMDASVIERLTVILHYADNCRSISETCRHFGISRSTFHRWMERFDPDNLSSLADKSHEPLTARHSVIPSGTIELVRRFRMRYPQMGKERIAELLLAHHNIDLSPSTVGRVIDRECLYFADTPLHWKKRMDHERGSAPVVPAETAPVVVQDPAVAAGTSAARPNIFRRLLIISSVVTNIAFVSMLFGMALYESGEKAVPPPTESQQVLHAAPSANFLP